MTKNPNYYQLNNLFYKYYNNNIEDFNIIQLIPDELYILVHNEILNFNTHKHLSKLSFNRYMEIIYTKIIQSHSSIHEEFINILENK